MFNNSNDLKAQVLANEPEVFFDEYLRGGTSKYFEKKQLRYFCSIFSDYYNLEIREDEIFLVGSAKIGFALHDKKRKVGSSLKAFRPYSPKSDVDLTICNADLFRKIWYELSEHACLQNQMPWNPSKLADYLLYGWLRPDKFPKGAQLTHCDGWYRTVGRFKSNRTLGHPSASVALYYSEEQLKRYQVRSIGAAKARLETT